MRTYIIGDVHGCLNELRNLIAEISPRHDDRFIFVGDLVDKGPDSVGVLHHVQHICRLYPGSEVVSGNHEEKASRDFKAGRFNEPWFEKAEPEDWAFIDSMPLTWYDPEINVRVIHGGIFPALLNNHPDVFEKIEARGNNWRKGGGKVMSRARRMLRIRYVSKDEGDMLALGANQKGDPFWADVYDGSEGFVVYGHSPQLNGLPRYTDHTLGIDTACVFGHKLSAAVFEHGSEVSIVSVSAQRAYAQPLKGLD